MIFSLLSYSCSELFWDEKYSLFWSKKVFRIFYRWIDRYSLGAWLVIISSGRVADVDGNWQNGLDWDPLQQLGDNLRLFRVIGFEVKWGSFWISRGHYEVNEGWLWLSWESKGVSGCFIVCNGTQFGSVRLCRDPWRSFGDQWRSVRVQWGVNGGQ